MAVGIGVALVGYGFAGKTLHAPLIGSVGGLELRVVVSSRPEDVRVDLPRARVVPSLDDALAMADVDLVVLATPNDSHFGDATRALSRGKHVVVDKPITVTAGDARELATTARATGLVLSAFHNRRWDSDFLTLRALVESGALGSIVELESRFDRFRPEVRSRWREQPGPGTGIWYDLGPHLVDQSLVLFGAPGSVFADLAMQRDGATVTDSFHVVLGYPTVRVVLRATSLAAAETPRFVVQGTRASWVKLGTDSQEGALRAGRSPAEAGFGTDPRDGTLTTVEPDGTSVNETVPTKPGDYRRYYELVRDAIAGRGPNPVLPEDAVAVMEVIEAAIASAEAGRAVAVGPTASVALR